MASFKDYLNHWSVTILVVGLFLALIGLAFVVFAPKTDHLTSTAEGVVSRVEEDTYRRKGEKKTTYLTYVRFEDSDHQVFEARSVVNGQVKRHHEGDKVTVHFDPRDPTAGCLIEGDEDRLALFDGLRYLFQYGGGATLIVGIVGMTVHVIRRKQALRA